ncbi:hypothetical protein OK074_8763 [Actinobacteria bacterium OK074]|nr:hypothetical protein OK074_8763 [Actinobacteria bacterium OK074]
MNRRPYAAALLTAALLTTAACSSKYGEDTGGSAAPSRAGAAANRTVTPVEGCGTTAWTNPKNLSPTRTPAHCSPGSPAPDPLPEPRKLTIATGTLSAEYVAPLEATPHDQQKSPGPKPLRIPDPDHQ